MSNPESVPNCIKALSSTTFIAEVTAPALAVLVPLLIRALNDRSMEVQRRTVVVIDNLVKLVRDVNVAALYLSPLVEGVQKIAKGAAFPEVRNVCRLYYYTDKLFRSVLLARRPLKHYLSLGRRLPRPLPHVGILTVKLQKLSPFSVLFSHTSLKYLPIVHPPVDTLF